MEKQRANDAIVRLGNLLVKARLYCVHKLSSKIRVLRKKGEEKHKARIDRLLKEIEFLKLLKNSRTRKGTARLILVNTDDHNAEIEKESTTPDERAFFRLCKTKCISDYIKKFREDNIDWNYWLPPLVERWDKKIELKLKERRDEKRVEELKRIAVRKISALKGAANDESDDGETPTDSKTKKRQNGHLDNEPDESAKKEQKSSKRKNQKKRREEESSDDEQEDKPSLRKKSATQQLSPENPQDSDLEDSEDPDKPEPFRPYSLKYLTGASDGSEAEESDGVSKEQESEAEDQDSGEGDHEGQHSEKSEGQGASDVERNNERSDSEDSDMGAARLQPSVAGSSYRKNEQKDTWKKTLLGAHGSTDDDSDDERDGKVIRVDSEGSSEEDDDENDDSREGDDDDDDEDEEDQSDKEREFEARIERKFKTPEKLSSPTTSRVMSVRVRELEAASSEEEFPAPKVDDADEDEEDSSFFLRKGQKPEDLPARTVPKEQAPGMNRRQRRGHDKQKSFNESAQNEDEDAEYKSNFTFGKDFRPQKNFEQDRRPPRNDMNSEHRRRAPDNRDEPTRSFARASLPARFGNNNNNGRERRQQQQQTSKFSTYATPRPNPHNGGNRDFGQKDRFQTQKPEFQSRDRRSAPFKKDFSQVRQDSGQDPRQRFNKTGPPPRNSLPQKRSAEQEEKLHPSWSAKKRMSAAINQPFQGKKIVFDD